MTAKTSERTTCVDGGRIEVMDDHNSMTRDTLLLAREATHRMVVDGLRRIEMFQNGKDYRIMVRARC